MLAKINRNCFISCFAALSAFLALLLFLYIYFFPFLFSISTLPLSVLYLILSHTLSQNGASQLKSFECFSVAAATHNCSSAIVFLCTHAHAGNSHTHTCVSMFVYVCVCVFTRFTVSIALYDLRTSRSAAQSGNIEQSPY